MSARLALGVAGALAGMSVWSAQGSRSGSRRGAAVLFVDLARRKVLLLRRGPTAPWRPGWWNLPGGVVEAHETFKQGAAREAVEESGLHPGPLMLAHAMEDDGFDMQIFATTTWSGRLQIDHESDAVRWVPFGELSQMRVLPGAAEALRAVTS